jgi:ubiquitin-protein ligase
MIKLFFVVLITLVNLLKKPNPHSPLEGKIAAELRDHPEVFNKNAINWTNVYAKS